jgi:2-polyprenyl-3-methyl-5-hydroxy-6-metoxy-1,4-benzoquinol methylase
LSNKKLIFKKIKMDKQAHWEQIYQNKSLQEVSWYQPKPETSLSLIHQWNTAKDAAIIDVGGGDSLLADYLIEGGFTNITVMDISESALLRAKKRLGNKAKLIKWVVADAANFSPTEQYDVWHDRAAFHFLTQEADIKNYIQTVQTAIRPNGVFILGTFSTSGPKKCSGIDIKQYDETSMKSLFVPFFEPLDCFTIDHTTPAGNIQNFIFCSFRRQ